VTTALELEHVLERDEEAALVVLAGELDVTNVDLLDELLAAIDAGPPVVLDLTRLLFVDSAALNRLFRLVRERGSDGVAFVVEPGAPVATTLAIVGLGRAATVASTRARAYAALARATAS